MTFHRNPRYVSSAIAVALGLAACDSTVLPVPEVPPGASGKTDLPVFDGDGRLVDARADSDWDFAYLGTNELDPSLLYADLAIALGTDHVDLLNLQTAGGLIRRR